MLVLGHGAGGGANAADLELLARRLPSVGATVVRFEQPWRTSGRRGCRAAAASTRRGGPPSRRTRPGQAWATGPLFVGGRSAGARVACRTAPAVDAVGVVCLAFPLHLPGRPDEVRAAGTAHPGGAPAGPAGDQGHLRDAGEIRAAPDGRAGIRLVDCRGPTTGFRVAKVRALPSGRLARSGPRIEVQRVRGLVGDTPAWRRVLHVMESAVADPFPSRRAAVGGATYPPA